MTYTVGDRKITIEKEQLSESDKELILAHSKLFRYCLNNSCYSFLLSLKKIIHLYTDIITIYSTLLRKVPHYDDVTLMTNRTKLNILKLEDDFNRLFGTKVEGEPRNKIDWEEKAYEHEVKKKCILCVESVHEVFDLILKNLNCIDIFFNSFDNLKKLLIPFLANQTKSIYKSLAKALYLFKLTTIADEVSAIRDLSPAVLKQLRKIEKITSGIERESLILNTAFSTFDSSLQQYTSILLGKAILKRDVDTADCQLVKRRDICYQAAEHVVSIPLSEDQSSGVLIQALTKHLICGAFILAFLVTVILYRLFEVVFS
ncbi:Piso0_000222 [Millerozyma farinosa CBS 7064]|uniref:Piso0_000222 protein n=1 Tax=Pichia sorbitophila (strain ATCC MYA-4447 / BCRC 22081 / CBS 7064 / NBRC 10061 / NRRL Y-12695) TaxID=559304 RepID=G8YTE5_PICSO|nr:Piso0_000222 [Millerozyma farinosa CBS 7064]